jgi:hypothetical protein
MTQLKPFDDLFAAPPGEVPDGYKELFQTQSATEQDWAGVVDSWPSVLIGVRVFENYLKDVPKCRTATAAGHSLLAANGLDAGENWGILKREK